MNFNDVISLSCPHCGAQEAQIEQVGPHMKATCISCRKFIKFIPKSLFNKVESEPESESESLDLLKEINFKLDIVLDYLEKE